MAKATIEQGKHLIEVFETLDSGQLQALIASGILADARRCAAEGDPTKIDRDQLQKILGLDPSAFRVLMGGPENTDQIVAALRESKIWVNEYITQTNFSLKLLEPPVEDEIEIIDPGCSFSEEEGLKFLADAKLERPTYEHGIRFSQQYGKTTTSTKKPYIIFLHEPWQDPRGPRRVLYVDRRPGAPRARLGLSRRQVQRQLCLGWCPASQAASGLGRFIPLVFGFLIPLPVSVSETGIVFFLVSDLLKVLTNINLYARI